jgi:hypothetical protein
MTASLFDSPTWRGLFQDADLSPLFTDTAELRAKLLVMGTLALTQAKAGLIPDVSAQAIQRASMEVQVDPAALSKMTAETGDPVIALVAEFGREMQAPEHAKWIHFDSDPALTAATGLSLRLRQAFKIIGKRSDNDDVPGFAAYHDDPATSEGLAAGLGLLDGHGHDPNAAITNISGWIEGAASRITAQTVQHHAIKHQITHLNATIQTAPPETASLINAMTLPQMVLGLGIILN